jgi:hypothetical protein
MVADVHPWAFPGTTITATFPQTDKYTDFGFDSQYQYQGDNFWFTLRGSYIHEIQNLDASFANGLAANATNDLNEARAYASLAYGNDNRIVLTGQYFNISGSPDPILYGGLASGFSPNSNGLIAEIAYIPSVSNLGWWPWVNARIGLQYTWYNKFDGTTVGAQNKCRGPGGRSLGQQRPHRHNRGCRRVERIYVREPQHKRVSARRTSRMRQSVCIQLGARYRGGVGRRRYFSQHRCCAAVGDSRRHGHIQRHDELPQ